MKELLDFLNTLCQHTRIVAQIDEVVRNILDGNVDLLLPSAHFENIVEMEHVRAAEPSPAPEGYQPE